MKIDGRYVITAPRMAVWQALNDPAVLRRAIPGCQELVASSPTQMTAKVKARIGPVSATFSGDVTLSELDPPNSYRLTGQGSGGVAGYAKGVTHVTLADVDGGTELAYEVDVEVGGKLAQIGSRLILGASKVLADQFFQKFSLLVLEPPPSDEAKVAPEVTVEPAPFLYGISAMAPAGAIGSASVHQVHSGHSLRIWQVVAASGWAAAVLNFLTVLILRTH